jgi:two-component system NtrC family sensor kinase
MRADGSRLPIELAIAEVRLPERRLFTAYLRNLTEVKSSAAEIERQRDALHQSEKLSALGSLLAGVAHELNNPLSIVIGHAVMLRDEAEEAKPSELATRAQKIQNAAERCARIVRTFLAMARQRSTERRAIALGSVVRGALELLGYGLRTSGIEVEATIADDLPDVWADEDQLHQVVLNLLVNAQQALEVAPRPRRLAVTLAADGPRARAVLRVADNGPGVPEDIRSRIFDPFFTTKPTGTGTGIGLAVSRGIVEAHGGSLRLDPAPARGAVFILELPAAPPDAGAEPYPGGARGAPAAAATRRALIVDDEPDIAGMLAQILARQGFRADVATGGREALRLVAAHDYDAILCDLRMPDLDGPAFYQFLEAERAHLCARTVFVTGDTLGQAASRFVAASGRPVIEKPFVPDEVRRVVAGLG